MLSSHFYVCEASTIPLTLVSNGRKLRAVGFCLAMDHIQQSFRRR